MHQIDENNCNSLLFNFDIMLFNFSTMGTVKGVFVTRYICMRMCVYILYMYDNGFEFNFCLCLYL